VTIISNIHDYTPIQPRCTGRSGILFVGSIPHLPNQQAIRHLLEDVLPLVLPLLPTKLQQQFQVHIVGGTDQVPPALAKLFHKHAGRVVFHGWLSDEILQMLYTRVKVVVAPLLSGAGVKGKVSKIVVAHAGAQCASPSLPL
jgi:glycosyltransferase involved in cell wall biosynthesis